MTFSELALNPHILSAIAKQGYKNPTPIQEQAIPIVLQGKDLMAAAQTGTGKTAGFTLPMLHLLATGKSATPNQARALVLTPTRELAAQVAESIETYGSNLRLKYKVVFGGVKINPQLMAMRKGVDILVATPGRLLDLYQQNAIRFDHLEMLILDEADRMLDMGFIKDIRRIIKLLPQNRQNLMFSATFSPDIRQLATGLMNSPEEVSVTPRNEAAKTVEQWLIPVNQNEKTKLLIKLIKQHKWYQVLVFNRTKHGANRLAQRLAKQNINAAAIHGDKSQSARTRALAGFKDKSIQVLVATDIAARGIDIDQLPQVINFDLPQVAEDYVHRIGRTGRAGSEGKAISLVCADEFKNLNDIEQLIQQQIARKNDDEFNASPALPNSKPLKPLKPKKAKKPKGKVFSDDKPSLNKQVNNNNKSTKRRPYKGNRSGNSTLKWANKQSSKA
ncbi:DEAD/DEAH box helicase [Glaciecola petra]|uniref:DEAD/DEAH box helicase n=1 Tax=Glaciecola petra TaxID=3075602 RepID=A0ABU2ZVF6_9ALTE|nr:DEAD/DEAH box helicase [Aestuariibacter sp. P117]MDT0596590.1 DEAD/DEAH box helicase [Aestuariibacter sp. P117]